MKTTIGREQDGRKGYLLDRDDKGLLELTFDNVCKVEAMINENRSYRRAQDPQEKPDGKIDGYPGSSAYWFSLLFKKLENGECTTKKECEKLVAALDSENTTHLNSRKDNSGNQGRDVMRDRVFELLKNFECFRDTLEKGKTDLITKLAKPTEKYAGRELAFASKFCHYAAFWLFKGRKEADNYSIFDSIVSKALVKYAKKYLGDIKEVEEYKRELRKVTSKSKTVDWKEYPYEDFYNRYRDLIDATRKAAQKGHGEDYQISRNGFDHLLWYAS